MGKKAIQNIYRGRNSDFIFDSAIDSLNTSYLISTEDRRRKIILIIEEIIRRKDKN